MEKLRGIVPVPVTPLLEDGSPDSVGHGKLLEYLLAQEIGGLWVLGSASEDFLLTFAQRVDIAHFVAERVAGRTPIIMGAAFSAFAETMAFVEATSSLRLAGYHILPTDHKQGDWLVQRYLARLADEAPHPLWLYNNPLRGARIAPPVVTELSAHPNVAGAKAAGYDLRDILPMCALESANFQTLGSGGGHLPLFLAYGCVAHTVSAASMFPAEYCQAFRLWNDAKHTEARALLARLGGCIRALPHPHNTEFSAEEKAVLEIKGICNRYVAYPFVPCSDTEMEQTREALRRFGM